MDAPLLPTGWANFTVPVASEGDTAVVRATLERFGVLAALSPIDLAVEPVLRGRLLTGRNGAPLAIDETDTLNWREADVGQLAAELAARFGRGVSIDAGFFGDDGQPTEPRPDEVDVVVGRNVDGFAWFAKGRRPILGLSARHVGAALLAAPVEGGTLIANPSATNQFVSLDPLSQSDNVILWRLGRRRGAMLQFRKGSAIHAWDEEWTTLDFARPWLRDADQRSAASYLRDVTAAPDDETEWTTLLQLEPREAQELRILLRRARSDESTFSSLVALAGAPDVVAEVAEGRVAIEAIPDLTSVQPMSLWTAWREELAEGLTNREKRQAADEAQAR